MNLVRNYPSVVNSYWFNRFIAMAFKPVKGFVYLYIYSKIHDKHDIQFGMRLE